MCPGILVRNQSKVRLLYRADVNGSLRSRRLHPIDFCFAAIFATMVSMQQSARHGDLAFRTVARPKADDEEERKHRRRGHGRCGRERRRGQGEGGQDNVPGGLEVLTHPSQPVSTPRRGRISVFARDVSFPRIMGIRVWIASCIIIVLSMPLD